MGDFSGLAYLAETPDRSAYRLMNVTLDTLDTLCERIAPALQLETGLDSQPLTLAFRSLEDFHPDNICRQLQLLDPAAFEVFSTDAAAPEQQAQDAQSPSAPAESERDTVERLLGKRSVEIERQRAGVGGVSNARRSLIQDVVRHLANRADTSETTTPVETRIDAIAATSKLRALLHAPEFKTLEATWRSLDWLLRSVEADENTTYYLLDIAESSLRHEIGNGGEVADSGLYRDLQGQVAGDVGDHSDLLLIGDLYFGISPDHIQLLDALGQLVSGLGGTLVTAADSDIFDQSPAPALLTAWEQFRKAPVSQHILLALPRILLRLPYGKTTDPIDAFDFEELEGHEPDRLLWGNPAFACAILMLQPARGTPSEPVSAILEMPSYSYRADDVSHLQPCTEQQYSERQIDRLLSLGLIPILGSQRSNIIQVPWLQSMAIDV